ncbi:helix-turn-helix transcriptional regulator [Oscillospiraceae bacterium 21-37]|uniref:helix-turn-helix domain-containing protein n=1 Tax=Acutalibacter sp. JLR.KK004 TaxID=3112622 RepID=UPI002FEEAED3
MIKNHLSRILGERRWTQAKLSRETGIRPGTINDLYQGLAERVSFEHLDKICEALGCDLSELLEYIPNQQPRTGENLILEEHGNRRKKTS